jgi:hypothetical protein
MMMAMIMDGTMMMMVSPLKVKTLIRKLLELLLLTPVLVVWLPVI